MNASKAGKQVRAKYFFLGAFVGIIAFVAFIFAADTR